MCDWPIGLGKFSENEGEISPQCGRNSGEGNVPKCLQRVNKVNRVNSYFGGGISL